MWRTEFTKRVGPYLLKAFRPPSNADLFSSIEDEYGPWKHLLQGRVLNAGAGNRDISHLVNGELFNQDIADGLHNENIHIYSPLDQIPKPDNTFDCVICNAVLEHVRNPHEVMCEFFRVLKPSGVLFLGVPFLQPEHLDPTDFQRYTCDGLKQLCVDHGFRVQAAEAKHSVYATLGWIIRDWLSSRKDLSGAMLKAAIYPWLRQRCRRAQAELKTEGRLSPKMQVHSIASSYLVIAAKEAASDPWPARWVKR